ncbi:MAG: sigma factor-like helix-turn-helix DNA-binding protein [Patescibacteria group bacterium]|nr:sigma factor-like helix-turn-helix DNA-binding protein [Patescibacteria group bacterium]MDD5715086.1 sigma factor-like helix-turn-helix DNA-binding protein [Patescibacteria group bacterium]
MNQIQQSSILDRVLSSQKTSAIEQFNPSEVVTSLLKCLTPREEDVLRRRYGLLGKHKETLEEIGATYHVTRERIRQIEKTAVVKIKRLKNFYSLVSPIENTVFTVLEQRGGIMSEESLLAELLQVVGNNEINQQNILFIISELLDTKFKAFHASQDFRESWQLFHAPLHLMRETISVILKIITDAAKPLKLEEIIDKIKKDPFYSSNQSQLSEDVIASYINISSKIARNPFNDYGLGEWGSIIPRRMNDKIYLVLKRNGKPLHFSEIAKRINEIKFDDRKAYPPTVHNELILNDRYILVGRGIYALREWGYKPGVVANVLEDILKQSGQPMKRDELVEKVLEQRMVKKNTIHLALTDKTKFQKLPDGSYKIAD